MTYARQATDDLPDVIYGVEFDGNWRHVDGEYRIYATKAPAKSQMTTGRGKSLWVGHVVWKRLDEAK